MDAFLDYLIKKSDVSKEFSIKGHSSKKKRISEDSLNYKKISIPSVESYVVFDFETTGMNPIVNRIIEIGAVKVIDNNIVDSFSQLINPMQYITTRISNVVNITNDMVEDCPIIEDVLPNFLEFIADFPLVAHNARFDMWFLINNAHRLGYEVNNVVLDTLLLSRKFNEDCIKHNLNYLTKHFNVKLEHAHRAYYDALATCSIYKIIQSRYKNTLAI